MSEVFGLFYDNPTEIQNRNLCRSTLGILINEEEENKINGFLAEYPDYQLGSLPTSKCISHSHPFMNALSFILIIGKVYPKLGDYIKKNELKTAAAIM